jgi:LysE type translocator
MHSDLIGFVGVAAVVTIAPAADFALVSRRALSAGARAAIITASGICSGVPVWGALSALGVAAIVTASADAYAMLRLAGAAYLVFLGIQALLRARRLAAAKGTQDDSAAREAPGGFRQGLVTNLLNPQGRDLLLRGAAAVRLAPRSDPACLLAVRRSARADGDELVLIQRASALPRTARIHPPTRTRCARGDHRRRPHRPGTARCHRALLSANARHALRDKGGAPDGYR